MAHDCPMQVEIIIIIDCVKVPASLDKFDINIDIFSIGVLALFPVDDYGVLIASKVGDQGIFPLLTIVLTHIVLLGLILFFWQSTS
jgi:hypothetical protein